VEVAKSTCRLPSANRQLHLSILSDQSALVRVPIGFVAQPVNNWYTIAMMHELIYPRLRSIEVRQVVHQGRQGYLLRDPLQISDQVLIIPLTFGPALALCDGMHHRDQLKAACGLLTHNGQPDYVDELLNALDDALMLETPRYTATLADMQANYRAAAFRPMSHADAVYPADPTQLQRMIDDFIAEAGPHAPLDAGVGIFSPHIDYARGGKVYAAVWQRAAQLAREAERVVLLATDHYGDEGSLTLTRQHYATPFGVLPTAQAAVDQLVAAIGEEAAFAGELRHRQEHSIELVAVWLHAMRAGRPVELVPILCGSFGHFVRGDADPATDPSLTAVTAVLRELLARPKTLVVVSGDLAHVGPAFGGRAITQPGRERVKAADQHLLDALCAGDPHAFFGAIAQIEDRHNVCGLPPGYLALQALAANQGELVAYEQCPADEQQTSFVSIGGVVLR
jgi:hypothetical protein